MASTFPVWVSRRWWPWPKRYVCKYAKWCHLDDRRELRWADGPDGKPVELVRFVPGNGAPEGILFLILPDERRVFINATGRIVIFGREFFLIEVEKASREAGQQLPILRSA